MVIINEIRTEYDLMIWENKLNSKAFSLYSLWVLINRSFKNNLKLNKLAVVVHLIMACGCAVMLSTLGNPNIGRVNSCIIKENFNNSNKQDCLSDAELIREHYLLDQNITFLVIIIIIQQFLQIILSTLVFSTEVLIFEFI
jgi:hypothetical protein